jgi:hypothetical protein
VVGTAGGDWSGWGADGSGRHRFGTRGLSSFAGSVVGSNGAVKRTLRRRFGVAVGMHGQELVTRSDPLRDIVLRHVLVLMEVQ